MEDHTPEKKDFLNTVFDSTVGGGAIVYVVLCMALIFLILFLG